MRVVRELELWSEPGRMISDSSLAKLKLSFEGEFKLVGVFLCLSSIPGQTDVDNLVIAFEEGELLRTKFRIFCEAAGLEEHELNKESACKYLEFEYGRKIAWLHIPEALSTSMYLCSIARWSRRNRLALVDPDDLCCLVPW